MSTNNIVINENSINNKSKENIIKNIIKEEEEKNEDLNINFQSNRIINSNINSDDSNKNKIEELDKNILIIKQKNKNNDNYNNNGEELENIETNLEEKKEDEKEDEKEEKEEKSEDEEEQEDEEEEEKNEGKKESDKNLNNLRFRTNSIKRAEKEIEESSDRITYLKEKLIESRKGQFCTNVKLSEREIFTVIEKALLIFENEPSMLELEPPLYICGDIHGQFYDLLRVFDILKYPPKSRFLFLGDYVDRGKKSLECILLLLCLKIKYPTQIYLLRGNHESADVNRTYGFFDECKRKVSVKIYKKFCNLFNMLPITALVGEKILCMHGGLAYELKDINQLKLIKRPTEIPEAGLLCDLVWSDPDDSLIFDFKTNKERGISVCFSKKLVEDFTQKHDLDLICRAHQVVEEGFQFFANMKLITIFTAPNYMGEFDNNGGILEVDEDLHCSLHILKANINNVKTKKLRKIYGLIN